MFRDVGVSAQLNKIIRLWKKADPQSRNMAMLFLAEQQRRLRPFQPPIVGDFVVLRTRLLPQCIGTTYGIDHELTSLSSLRFRLGVQ